jgi:hypothetical protein
MRPRASTVVVVHGRAQWSTVVHAIHGRARNATRDTTFDRSLATLHFIDVVLSSAAKLLGNRHGESPADGVFVRSGSTVMENILKALLPRGHVMRYHPRYGKEINCTDWQPTASRDAVNHTHMIGRHAKLAHLLRRLSGSSSLLLSIRAD